MFTPALNQLEKKYTEMVDTLVKWASINSGSYHLEGLQNMLQTLKQDFSILPSTSTEVLPLPTITHYADNGSTLQIPLGQALRLRKKVKGKINIFFNGHMDTVYGKDDPFQTCTFISDYRLQGPGVTDMKGGLVVLLFALTVFELTPWAEAIDWEILLTPDEEIGSPGSSLLFEEAAKNHHFGLIFEPSNDGQLIRARKGVGEFVFISKGKSAHAGRAFNEGINAILPLAELILELNKLNQTFPNCIFNVGKITGGGATNVVPEHAMARLSIRYTNTEDADMISKTLEGLVKYSNENHSTKIEMQGGFNRPPKVATKATESLFKVIQSCGKEIGLELDWHDSGGASDGNLLSAAGLPNIDNLGVRGDKIHSPNEFIELGSLVERSQLTLLLLMKLATGDISLPNELITTLPQNDRTLPQKTL